MTLSRDDKFQIDRLGSLSTELVQVATLMFEAAVAKDVKGVRRLNSELDRLSPEIAEVVPANPGLAPGAVARAAGIMAVSIGEEHGFKASEGTLRLETNAFHREILGGKDDDD